VPAARHNISCIVYALKGTCTSQRVNLSYVISAKVHISLEFKQKKTTQVQRTD